jgi:hypothetical protein
MYSSIPQYKKRNKIGQTPDSMTQKTSHEEEEHEVDRLSIPYSSENDDTSDEEDVSLGSSKVPLRVREKTDDSFGSASMINGLSTLLNDRGITDNKTSALLQDSQHFAADPDEINEDSLSMLPYSYDQGSMLRYSDRSDYIKPLPESVLKGLLKEEKIISQGIDNLVSAHSQRSQAGGSTKQLRKDLIQYLKSLGMLYQALAEIYDKETQRNLSVLSTFNKWNHNKRELSEKVKEIKSEENEEGRKLGLLQNEMTALNGDIQALETRLRQMKDKRKTLKSEIMQTQSVIESRSSSYLEEINDIEVAEREKIKELTEGKSMNPINNSSQNFNFSSLLNRFSSTNESQANSVINPSTVVETIARQAESFKDRTTSYKSQETIFQETGLVWENISELLDQLETDIQNVLSESPQNLNQSTMAKTKIINLLNQAHDSLASLHKSLRVQNNPILDQLFATEIDTIRKSLEVLGAPPKRKSIDRQLAEEAAPQSLKQSPHSSNYIINKKSIMPHLKKSDSNVGITSETLVADKQSVSVSSSQGISPSSPSIDNKGFFKGSFKGK